MVIILSVIGIVVICTATVVLTGLYGNSPTKGALIENYANPKAALLVIDVQNDITGNTGQYGDTTDFVKRINEAIIFAEENNMEILYIKNTFRNPLLLLLSGGRFREGTKGAELDGTLSIVNDNIFLKHIGDSFSSTEMEEYLISQSVDTLYLVGADAAACVYITARGAINRGYNVNIIEDAIITINEKTLAQMLEQYEKDGIKIIKKRLL